MTSMLRPLWSANGSFVNHSRKILQNGRSASRLMSTQSSGDTEPPSKQATLYLEDGTKLTAKSFGCHESVEGEVSEIIAIFSLHAIQVQSCLCSFVLICELIIYVTPILLLLSLPLLKLFIRLFSPPVWLVTPNL